MVPAFTILFVEDDAGIRDSTAELLASKGFHLLVARDGREALRLLSEHHIDVLFTDIVMPEVNGIELAKQARELHPDLKIMFMTGYYSRASEAARLGTLLYKPLRGVEIEAELLKLIAA
jgi:CheY-like chemotaxis protein